MRWIIWRRVRLALMTMPRFASGTSMPSSSTRGAATASSLRTRRSSRISRRCRRAVDPVIRSIDTSGSSRLIAWFAARTVSVNTSAPSASLIAGRQAAEQLVLADRLRHDLAPLGERVEVVARGAAVGAGVALGEVRDRGEEVAERLERHVAHRAQVLARAHEPLLDRGVLGPLVDRAARRRRTRRAARAHTPSAMACSKP